MKNIVYLTLSFLSAILFGCAEIEQPYVGRITIERAVVEAAANSSTTIVADTDIPNLIELKSIDFGEGMEPWCEVAFNGTEITVTATQANTVSEYRTATVNVKCGYRLTSFVVLQKYEGQSILQYDWTEWSATGSDVEESDGGGYASLFTEDRTKFWHSSYSNGDVPCPHWLLIDMKQNLECVSFAIGRRLAGVNNYPSVKNLEVWVSTDNENFTKVGGFTFALPWIAPDGTVVEGNSPLVPAEEVITLEEPVTARYVKLVITETNNNTGVCQVSYFKAYGAI